MRVNRQQSTRMVLVLAVLLASVWTANLAASAAGQTTSHLGASRPLAGIEPAILRDRLPVVRPSVERAGHSGRLMPALLGVLVAAVGLGVRAYARWSRAGSAPARSLPRRSRLEARAPPRLQPA